jgi:hypothetical protein
MQHRLIFLSTCKFFHADACALFTTLCIKVFPLIIRGKTHKLARIADKQCKHHENYKELTKKFILLETII